MFIFNRDNTLYTKDKDVQMLMPDAFDIDYQEVFTSEKDMVVYKILKHTYVMKLAIYS